jgi:uncharacterized membrane protein
MSTSRLEAFSDGVFAIAITLLVLNLQVPRVPPGGLARALLEQWPSYLSYVVSFFVIGIMWVNHHGIFRHIARVDRWLLFLNLVLLLGVCFLPFPTALLGQYIQADQDARVAAIAYACTSSLIAVGFNGIWTYAVHRGLLHPTRVDHERARATILRFGLGLLVYPVGIVVAFFSAPLSLALFALIAVYYLFDQTSSAIAVPGSDPEN